MHTIRTYVILLLLPIYTFCAQDSLSQLLERMDSVKEGTVWTSIHKKPKGFNQYYISSVPRSEHRKSANTDPVVVETTLTTLSKSECKLLLSSLKSGHEHQHDIKPCGDWEPRAFATEFVLSPGTVVNIVYKISFSEFHCGEIYVYSSSDNKYTTFSFTTKKRKQKTLLALFSQLIDTTCYGESDCMNGYCFSFQKPGVIRRKEQLQKMADEQKVKEESRLIAEKQRLFKDILLKQLNHLNSFDKKTLVLYRNIDSLSGESSLEKMIINLKVEAKSQQCILIWSDVKMAFYFEVPEEIRPIYHFPLD